MTVVCPGLPRASCGTGCSTVIATCPPHANSHGVHLFRLGDANLAAETIVNGRKVYQGATRRNPLFTGIWRRVTDAHSFYNSLQVSAVRRFGNGFRGQNSHTFSRTIDDVSGINSQDFFERHSIQPGLVRPHDRSGSVLHFTQSMT